MLQVVQFLHYEHKGFKIPPSLCQLLLLGALLVPIEHCINYKVDAPQDGFSFGEQHDPKDCIAILKTIATSPIISCCKKFLDTHVYQNPKPNAQFINDYWNSSIPFIVFPSIKQTFLYVFVSLITLPKTPSPNTTWKMSWIWYSRWWCCGPVKTMNLSINSTCKVTLVLLGVVLFKSQFCPL